MIQLILVPTKPSFQHAEQSINNVIMLKTYVSSIRPVYEALAGAQSALLLTIRDVCLPALGIEDIMLLLTLGSYVLLQTTGQSRT